MKIYLGADHGGFLLKEAFQEYLSKNKFFKLIDCGAKILNSEDDYPSFAFEVAEHLREDFIDLPESEESLGILFCRSASGMVIAANKVFGIRAVELYDQWIAEHAKSHNHANLLAFAADQLSLEQTIILFEKFLSTNYDSDQRHLRRLKMIADYEQAHSQK